MSSRFFIGMHNLKTRSHLRRIERVSSAQIPIFLMFNTLSLIYVTRCIIFTLNLCIFFIGIIVKRQIRLTIMCIKMQFRVRYLVLNVFFKPDLQYALYCFCSLRLK